MKNKSTEFEVRFAGDNKATIITDDPQAFFRIVTALKDRGYNPEFRHHDEEIGDMTCWQPSKAA